MRRDPDETEARRPSPAEQVAGLALFFLALRWLEGHVTEIVR